MDHTMIKSPGNAATGPGTRLDWVDAAKGIGMILVIFLHAGAASHWQVAVGAFHMPLFFFMTGFFLFQGKQRDFICYSKAKARSLLVPYIIFGVILAGYSTAIDLFVRHNDVTPGFRFVGLLVNERCAPFYGSLWFLLVLFSVEIVLYLLHKLIRSDVIRLLLCIAVCVTGVMIQHHWGSLPLSFDLTMVCLLFTELGYLLFPYLRLMTRRWIFLVALAFFVVSTYANYHMSGCAVDLYSCHVGSPWLFMVAALLGVLLIMPLAGMMSRWKALLYVGRNSLLYYCLQFLLLIPLNKLFQTILPGQLSPLVPWLMTGLILVGLVPVINFINRRHGWILGKRNKNKTSGQHNSHLSVITDVTNKE